MKATKAEINRCNDTVANMAGRIIQEFPYYADNVVSEEEGYIPIGSNFLDSMT